ncbi:MAG: hypothetical protein ACTHMV_15720 [Chitinophagaceae bacterium]
MTPRRYNLLLHPLFLLSLFLLLLNDISLKYEFHNSFTGKLSDFTGLFVFTLFWMAVFPKHKWQITLATALIFIWWKSPFSSSFIQSWNEVMPVPLARVIDYWDLTALIMLPLAWLLARTDYNPSIKYRRFFIATIGCITLFSFCFTSPPRYALYYYPPNQIRFYGNFKTSKTQEQILDKLASKSISFHIDSISYYPITDGEYYLRTNEQVDSSKWVRVNDTRDSVLYRRMEERPFYLIPSYNLDGQELKNVKMRITQGNKKTFIYVESFQVDGNIEYNNKLEKQYKKHFKKLFE